VRDAFTFAVAAVAGTVLGLLLVVWSAAAVLALAVAAAVRCATAPALPH
jgi:hypothetical protein